MSVAPIHAVQAMTPLNLMSSSIAGAPVHSTYGSNAFSQMMLNGIDQVDQKMKSADAMVTAFALDDSIPPHQVMFALEQAHHSLEIMMQVRNRLVEGYQEIMRMQL